MPEAEKASQIIRYIASHYRDRSCTQVELAHDVNCACHAHLDAEDIALITQQLGYRHTIQRSTLVPVMVHVTERWKRHAM
jgi:hypothetical protein